MLLGKLGSLRYGPRSRALAQLCRHVFEFKTTSIILLLQVYELVAWNQWRQSCTRRQPPQLELPLLEDDIFRWLRALLTLAVETMRVTLCNLKTADVQQILRMALK